MEKRLHDTYDSYRRKERNCMASSLITDAINRAYVAAYKDLFGDISGPMMHCENTYLPYVFVILILC